MNDTGVPNWITCCRLLLLFRQDQGPMTHSQQSLLPNANRNESLLILEYRNTMFDCPTIIDGTTLRQECRNQQIPSLECLLFAVLVALVVSIEVQFGSVA